MGDAIAFLSVLSRGRHHHVKGRDRAETHLILVHVPVDFEHPKPILQIRVNRVDALIIEVGFLPDLIIKILRYRVGIGIALVVKRIKGS